MANPDRYHQMVDAMFEEFDAQVTGIAQVFMVLVMTDLVKSTPGPGNQYAGTEYYAQGYLRAGWTWSESEPPDSVSRIHEGPKDETGDLTVAKLSAEIMSSTFTVRANIWNEVAYALWVHEGKKSHAHIGPRPWVHLIGLDGQHYANQARAQVMGKS